MRSNDRDLESMQDSDVVTVALTRLWNTTTPPEELVQEERNFDTNPSTITHSSTSMVSSPSVESFQEQNDESVQVPGTKKRRQLMHENYHSVTVDFWTYELIGIFLCVGCLIAITAILFKFDDHPVPHSASGISLNTIIAVLAALSRATAGFVAASVIAQQKWLRFTEQSRSLIEVLLHDDATRGPLGSLYLITTLRLGFITALGATAATLAFGFEPFVQAMVRYQQKDLPIQSWPESLLPTVHNVSNNLRYDDSDDALTAVVSQALYTESAAVVEPTCAGSSCIWSNYQSAAFCHSCEDAMNDIIIEPKLDRAIQIFNNDAYLNELDFDAIDFGLPEGGSILQHWNTPYNISLGQGSTAVFNLSTYAWVDIDLAASARELNFTDTLIWNLYVDFDTNDVYWKNITINGVLGPLKAYGYLNMTPSTDGTQLIATAAKRCVISLCAKEYSSELRNGTLISNFTKMQWGSFYPSDGALFEEKIHDLWELQWVLQWAATLDDTQDNALFYSRKTWEDRGGSESQVNVLLEQSSFALERLLGASWKHLSRPGLLNLPTLPADFVRTRANFEQKIANVTEGLTLYILQNGDGYAKGQAYIPATFLQVRWAWLAFPITLVVTVVVTLTATMIKTRQKQLPIWKSSPFPLLYNYPRHDGVGTPKSGSEDAGVEVPSAMTTWHEGMAQRTHLRLRQKSGAWVFQREA